MPIYAAECLNPTKFGQILTDAYTALPLSNVKLNYRMPNVETPLDWGTLVPEPNTFCPNSDRSVQHRGTTQHSRRIEANARPNPTKFHLKSLDPYTPLPQPNVKLRRTRALLLAGLSKVGEHSAHAAVLFAGSHAKFEEHVRDVLRDRRAGKEELFADLRVGKALSHKL